MAVMLVLDIGYSYRFYDKIFTENKTHDAFVACLLDDNGNENSIVGYLMLELGNRNTPSYIQALFVEEAYRKRGIAKQLICEAENYSKSLGCKYITAFARSHLLRFYGKFGFSITGKKNDWTYHISKCLERDRQQEDDELEL